MLIYWSVRHFVRLGNQHLRITPGLNGKLLRHVEPRYRVSRTLLITNEFLGAIERLKITLEVLAPRQSRSLRSSILCRRRACRLWLVKRQLIIATTYLCTSNFSSLLFMWSSCVFWCVTWLEYYKEYCLNLVIITWRYFRWHDAVKWNRCKRAIYTKVLSFVMSNFGFFFM